MPVIRPSQFASRETSTGSRLPASIVTGAEFIFAGA
jgi:hypothetical protein